MEDDITERLPTCFAQKKPLHLCRGVYGANHTWWFHIKQPTKYHTFKFRFISWLALKHIFYRKEMEEAPQLGEVWYKDCGEGRRDIYFIHMAEISTHSAEVL